MFGIPHKQEQRSGLLVLVLQSLFCFSITLAEAISAQGASMLNVLAVSYPF